MRSLNQYTRKYPEDIADSSRVAYGWLTTHGIHVCTSCDVTLDLNPCRQLKLHFETPGAPQSESLSHLADGMTTAKAARLFYQACGMK
jgi:hypothetical protein